MQCADGCSKSVAMLVAYLMQKEKISLGKAPQMQSADASRRMGQFHRNRSSKAHALTSWTKALLSIKDAVEKIRA